MAKHVTTWRPDTCGCEVQYEWDDAVPEDQRVHSPTTVTKRCAAHASEPTHGRVFDKVTDENKRKNIFFAELRESVPEAFEDSTDAQGNTVKELKKGIQFNWSFDANRNLVVDLPGLTKPQKDRILNKINVRGDGVFTNKLNVR